LVKDQQFTNRFFELKKTKIGKGNPMSRKPRITSKGTCALCKSTFDKSGMTKHLQSCMKKNSIDFSSAEGESPSLRFYHLVVEGHHLPEYWMHLKISSQARFGDLDGFLREVWVECCGHLSAFYIEREEIGMNRKFAHVLQPEMKLSYEYDFGSTTELTLKVVSEFKSDTKTAEVEMLARNDPPQIKCSYCNNRATRICTECSYEGTGWLCDGCVEDHECGEDMLLPVVNSPRTGVCGYVG